MNPLKIIRLSLIVLFSISILPSISCQQKTWSLIIPVAQLEHAPWSDYTTAKFPIGIGIEKSTTGGFKFRGVGWVRNGNIIVGPSSGNMKGVNLKLSALYAIVNKSRFNFNAGLGYNYRSVKVEDGINHDHGRIIPNSIWRRHSVFNGAGMILEFEIIILNNLSIFAYIGGQAGYWSQDDTRYGNVRGLGVFLPFLDLIGIKYTIF